MVWSSFVGRITGAASRDWQFDPPFDLRRGLAPRCEWSCSQLRCDLSERPLSTGLTASTPGMVLAIKSRTWEAFKRSYYSLVTFSPYIEPNVLFRYVAFYYTYMRPHVNVLRSHDRYHRTYYVPNLPIPCECSLPGRSGAVCSRTREHVEMHEYWAFGYVISCSQRHVRAKQDVC